MCVPNVFDREGVEGEILWHFAKIEKSLLKKGVLPAEFVGGPLPKIRVSWRQNKQGKGRSRAWLLQPWRALEPYLLRLLPTLTWLRAQSPDPPLPDPGVSTLGLVASPIPGPTRSPRLCGDVALLRLLSPIGWKRNTKAMSAQTVYTVSQIV